MKRVFFLFLFSILFNICDAQTPKMVGWKAIGGSHNDYLTHCIRTSDGGFMSVGYSYSSDGDAKSNRGMSDFLMVKSPANPGYPEKPEWSKSMGGSADDIPSKVIQTNDGGYLVVGNTYSIDGDVVGNKGDNDIWVVKLDANGNLLWKKCYGGSGYDNATDLIFAPDGSYVICGNTTSTNGDLSSNTRGQDAWILKISSTGEILSSKTFGGSLVDSFNSIAKAADGGYIASGTTTSANGDVSNYHGSASNYWVVKLNASFNISWEKCYSAGTLGADARKVLPASDGGYLVVGNISGSSGATSLGDLAVKYDGVDIWVLKLDVNGAIIWQKTLGGSSYDSVADAIRSVDDGYLLTAETRSFDHDVVNRWVGATTQIWALKLTGAGILEWENTFGGASNSSGPSTILAIENCKYVVAGYTNISDDNTINHGKTDGWFITLTSSAAPTVTMAADRYSDICAGTMINFTATAKNAGVTPNYQWKKNGVNVGENKATYSSDALTSSDLIRVEVTSTALCNTYAKATSDGFITTITPIFTPSVTLKTTSPTNTFCEGGGIKLTATPTGSTGGYYTFFKNGIALSSSSTNPLEIEVFGLKEGDVVTVRWLLVVPCAVPDIVTSPPVTIHITPIPVASVSLSSDLGINICTGTTTTFTATPSANVTAPTYQWIKNTVILSNTGPVYTDNNLKTGDKISVNMTANLTCQVSSKYVSNTLTMNVNSGPVSVSIATASNICEGSAATFTATPVNAGVSPIYQWKKNGINVGTNSIYYTANSLSTGDIISLVMTTTSSCSASTTFNSNNLVITVTPLVTPAVVVTSIQGTTICTGTIVRFTSTVINGGPSPTFVWKVNGILKSYGSFSSMIYGPVNGDVITVEMTSSLPCTTVSAVSSTPLVMKVEQYHEPTFAVYSDVGTKICAGSTVTFRAYATDVGSAPVYQWIKNGNNVGDGSKIYTDSNVKNFDVIWAVVTTNATCGTPRQMQSGLFPMTVTPQLNTSVTIASDKGTIVQENTTVTFTATAVNGGTLPVFQWKKNGINVGDGNSVYTDATLVSGDNISVSMTGNAPCGVPATVNSNTIVMGVTPLPPNISYATPQAYFVNNAISALTPVNTGDVASAYTVNPALPSGLSINSTTGVISGKPLVTSLAKQYQVTATNSIGSSQFTLTITVNATPAPTIAASSVMFDNTTTTTTDLTWTNGNGSARAVFIAQVSSGNTSAINNSSYTGDSNYKTGSQVGTTGWYCIYNGTGDMVTITGLNMGANYRVQVIEYNGVSGYETYLNTPAITGGVQTPVTVPTVPATKVMFNSTTALGTLISWTNGNGATRAVFIAETANGSIALTDNTNYNSNFHYGNGQQVGTTGWYCIYNGNSNTGSVIGLKPGTTYRVQVIEYNGTNTLTKYLNSPSSPANVTTVLAAPTTQATQVKFTNTAPTSTGISWTNGNGAARAVFIAQTANGNTSPADFTYYSSNANFGNGKQVGTSGWYCIYNGTGNTASVTGLTTGTTYRVQVVEYNGPINSERYMVSPSSPANVTTPLAAPTVQAIQVKFNNTTGTTTGISWTNGNGASRAVFIAQTANGTTTLTDNTYYSSNVNFGNGRQVGTSGWYCIYNGTGNTAMVTGLTTGTTYRIQVVEYNGAINNEKYLGSPNSPANVTTPLAAPTVQALQVKFNNTTATTTGISWTNGNGISRAVFIAQTANGNTSPLDNTYYSSNANFGNGKQVGATGWYCIYNGTGSAATVTGLTTGATYRVQVVEYNGPINNEKYMSSPNSPANVTTPLAAPTMQAIQVKFNNTTATSTGISWTNGNGASRAVFIGQTANGSIALINNTYYSSNANFRNGRQVGSSGWYCIYNGTGNASVVTGLDAGTTYRVQVIEYNGAINNEKYISGPSSPANVTTTGIQAFGSGAGLNPLGITMDLAKATAVTPGIKLSPSNILSPNGDGKNDTWLVQNILQYPENSVTVFDLSGKPVFTQKGYVNDWDGRYQGAALNEGTYNYVIDPGDGTKAIIGFITIVRDR